ncbi:hypothetical protein P8452_45900 [Trifolium repens]|nr:hypothetical protein P8452_45900 [Trifolium repens]
MSAPPEHYSMLYTMPEHRIAHLAQSLFPKMQPISKTQHFPTYPVEADSCRENSAPLANMVNTCYKTAGNVLPNFIAVNFYMRSNGGGVFDIVDRINGHMLCGCSTVIACQEGAPFGSCKNISVPSSSPLTNTAGSFNGYIQFSVRSASPVRSPNCSLFLLFYFLLTAVLLQFR